MELPVFKLATAISPAERIQDLGNRIFPRGDRAIVERGTKVALESNLGNIEVDVGTGGVWASDKTRLWQFDPASGTERNLVTADKAQNISAELLETTGLIPELNGPFRLRTSRVSGAITVFTENDGPRQEVRENTTVLTEIEVDVSEHGLAEKTLRVVGGGGRFVVTLGEEGVLQGARGVWRPAVGKPELFEVMDQARADEVFRRCMDGVPLTSFSSRLAYYSAPAFSGQNLLYPVYVYRATATYDGIEVQLRNTIIPATEIGGPTLRNAVPQPVRTEADRPSVRPLPFDFQVRAGQPLPSGIAVNRKRLRAQGLNFDDFFAPGPAGTPLIVKPDLSVDLIARLTPLLGFHSAGAAWIGRLGGLCLSQDNAQGFIDEISSIGWDIRFNWGDGNAWRSDWLANNNDWVDSVDFVFYTGHAFSNAWRLAEDYLKNVETAGALDLWGDNLEWLVIAACGPLHDPIVGSSQIVGDVLQRWRNAFDGLHILMGYAGESQQNVEEGRRLIQYAKAGSTIMSSWFRTAQETQNGIWAGAYYVGDSTGSTRDDHLWDIGSVGPDVTNPTLRACTWVPC